MGSLCASAFIYIYIYIYIYTDVYVDIVIYTHVFDVRWTFCCDS